MKRYLLLLVAVIMTTLSFAQGRAMTQRHVDMNLPVQKTLAPKQRVFNQKPLHKGVAFVKGSKRNVAKRAQRRVAISSLQDLATDYVYGQFLYTYDEEQGSYVPATDPYATANIGHIEVYSEADNTIMIYGLYDENFGVLATVNKEDGTLTIASGQKLYEFAYGGTSYEVTMAYLMSETLTGTFTGSVLEDGSILINEPWVPVFTYQGQTQPYDDVRTTCAFLPNGEMTWKGQGDTDEYEEMYAPLYIEQDPETYTCTIFNFANSGDHGFVVSASLASDKSFLISSDQYVYYAGSTYGYYYPTGFDASTWKEFDLVGTGTEESLTASVNWTLMSTRGYYMGDSYPFTITRTDGVPFAYPEAEVGELVVAPEGLVTTDMPYSTIIIEGAEKTKYTATVKVGWASETEIYIQGIDKYLPEAWVKGTYDATAGTITIPVTYMGTYNQVPHFLGEYSSEGPAQIIIDYSQSLNYYEDNYAINAYKSSTGDTYSFSLRNFVIGYEQMVTFDDESAAVDALLTAKYLPENAMSEADIISRSENVKVIQMGNYVFIKSFFPQFPNSWVMGVVTTTTSGESNVDVMYLGANQLVGADDNGFNIYLTGYPTYGYMILFSYDAENNTWTSQTPCFASRLKNDTSDYAYAVYSGMTIQGIAPSGISNIAADKLQKSEGAWYTINGQRVAKPTQKGLYIHNGKKIVIK